jgi:hypothetical protein
MHVRWFLSGVVCGIGLVASGLFALRHVESRLGLRTAAPTATRTAPASVRSAKDRVVSVTREGITLTMRIPGGPAFLSELLPVSMSLSNHSGKLAYVFAGGCGADTWASLSGGRPSRSRDPNAEMTISCPAPIPTPLVDGATYQGQQLLVLTTSGAVTLTEHAGLLYIAPTKKPVAFQDVNIGNLGVDAFARHAPTFTLRVAGQVPTDCRIQVRRRGNTIAVAAPVAARSHLLYESHFSCGARGESAGGVMWWHEVRPRFDVATESHPCAPVGPLHTWSAWVGAPNFGVAFTQKR